MTVVSQSLKSSHVSCCYHTPDPRRMKRERKVEVLQTTLEVNPEAINNCKCSAPSAAFNNLPPGESMTKALLLALAIATTFTTLGCNLYDDVDEASSKQELIEEAKAALEIGECDKAIAAVNAIGGDDDEVLRLRGWAQLCAAGVTVNRVAETLLTYNASNATDFKVVGNLANALVPATTETYAKIDRAASTFSSIRNVKVRSLTLSLANIAKAAAVIAKQSGDRAKVRRSDIYSSASCIGQTCTSAPASCDPGMSIVDANDVADALDAAAAAASLDSDLGFVRSLASLLGDSTSVPRATRCIIVNNMLSE